MHRSLLNIEFTIFYTLQRALGCYPLSESVGITAKSTAQLSFILLCSQRLANLRLVKMGLKSQAFLTQILLFCKGVFNYFEPSIVRELKSQKLQTSIRASNDLCLPFESSNSFINTFCLIYCFSQLVKSLFVIKRKKVKLLYNCH